MSEDALTALRYLLPGNERPVYFASTGGADASLNIAAEFEDREVLVRDARALDRPPTLDREGFELRIHHTAVEDFYCLESVREAYEAEIRELVLDATAASAALVFDHTLRSDSPGVRGERGTREVASVIHNDYTDASAAKRVRDLLPGAEADKRLASRFAIVNVWRGIGQPVWNSPLACCDASSLEPQDLVAAERRAVDRVGELELVRWNPRHRWYYFPRMQPHEVLLIKTFDSGVAGVARRSIHSAFDNPLAPADAPPRESIESRLLVFF